MPEQRTSIHGRPVALIDAPSNLGLRPPADGASPGVYKLAGALRDNGLLDGLGALDGGVVVAPRYSAVWQPGDGVRNERAIERYSSSSRTASSVFSMTACFRSSLAATAVC